MVGGLDPRDDRQTQFEAGGPATAVEDVLLQEAENDSIAALSAQVPTLPLEANLGARYAG
jgi:hypothetical protein